MPAAKRAHAARARLIFGVMLPLVSSKIAAAKGVSSVVKETISCFILSSKTRKSLLVRPEINLPPALVTVTFKTIWVVPSLRTCASPCGSSSFTGGDAPGFFFWAGCAGGCAKQKVHARNKLAKKIIAWIFASVFILQSKVAPQNFHQPQHIVGSHKDGRGN